MKSSDFVDCVVIGGGWTGRDTLEGTTIVFSSSQEQRVTPTHLEPNKNRHRTETEP